MEPSCIAGGSGKWRSCLGKQFDGSSKTVNVALPGDPAIRLLDMNPKEVKAFVHPKTCTEMFIAALFIIAKELKESKCPSRDIILEQKIMKYCPML